MKLNLKILALLGCILLWKLHYSSSVVLLYKDRKDKVECTNALWFDWFHYKSVIFHNTNIKMPVFCNSKVIYQNYHVTSWDETSAVYTVTFADLTMMTERHHDSTFISALLHTKYEDMPKLSVLRFHTVCTCLAQNWSLLDKKTIQCLYQKWKLSVPNMVHHILHNKYEVSSYISPRDISCLQSFHKLTVINYMIFDLHQKQ